MIAAMDPHTKQEVSVRLRELAHLLRKLGQTIYVLFGLTWRWFFLVGFSTTAGFLSLASLTGFFPLTSPSGRFLRRLNLLIDLLSHLRPHYFVLLLLLMGAFFVGRRYWQMGLTAVFALINLIYLTPYYIAPATAATNELTYQAVMLNVYTHDTHYDQVLTFLEAANPDLIVLTEVLEGWRSALTPLAEQYPYTNHDEARAYGGIVIYSRFPLVSNEGFQQLDFTDAGRPTALVQLDMQGQPLTLVATHPRSPQRVSRLEQRNKHMLALGQQLSQHSGTTLLLGDMNSSPWSPAFQAFMNLSGLQNGRLGFGLQPTWPAPLSKLGIPIDHVLTTSDIHIRQLDAGHDVGSDHYPLIIEFSLNQP